MIADPPLARDSQPTDWTTDDGDPVPVASSYLDLSQTEDWTPVTFQFPDNPQIGGQSQDYFTTLKSELENQEVTNSTKEGQLTPQVHDPNNATQQRRSGVWEALNSAPWQPQLRSLYENFKTQLDTLGDAINVGTGEGNGGSLDPSRPMYDALQQCQDASDYDACMTGVCTRETQTLHDKFKPQLAALDDADLTYESAYWQYAMAVAANISDPADHQRMVLDAADTMLNDRDLVISTADLFLQSAEWAFPDYCDGGQRPAAQTPGVPDENSSPACPKQLNKLPGIGIDELFSVAVHCEEIEFELETKGWIGAFANVTFNPKAGTASAFIGVQAGALGQQVREGAFINSGPSGITDGGLRINESTSGPAFMTQSHTLNLSVAGTVPFSE